MILGLGSDITDITRIEAALVRFGARLEERVFTPLERERARAQVQPASVYAKRFAAKEACIKALNARNHGVSWLEIEIGNLDSGIPLLRVSGNALKRMRELTPRHMQPFLHVSMSDEYPYAQATVIFSAEVM